MFLEVQKIQKSFGTETVLQDVSLQLEAEKTLSILGRSGSGKTTLLKIIAGLETPDQGAVWLENKEVTALAPQHRGVVYLYQAPLLFPHLNVFENIAFGLRLKSETTQAIQAKVKTMLENLELEAHATKFPNQLSGGQLQRVAFGRALIINPKLLLLDEPFGKLDVETRANMQQLFQSLAKTFKITALFVTHDLKEALLMGDQLSHMREGNLKIYPTKQDFIEDASLGVQQEIAFWNALTNENTS